MLMRPKERTVSSTIALTSAGWPTSLRMKIALPPSDAICEAVSLPPASSMSAIATLAPSRANSRAASRPKPDAAPVISATFSLSRSMVFSAARLTHQARVRAAVDRDVGAVDERGTLGGEEQDQIGDFLGLAGPLERRHPLVDLVETAAARGTLGEQAQALGEDGPGIDPDHAHADPCALLGKRLGEMVERGVGRPAHHVARGRAQSAGADHVDDHAAELALHLRQHFARHPDIAEKFKRPVVEPILVADLAELSGTRAARVVHQDIDAAVSLDASRDDARDAGGGGEVRH